MAKYSFEFKLQLVKEYLSGHAGHKSIAAKYGIHPSILNRWINNYQNLGEDSLARSRQQPVYAFERIAVLGFHYQMCWWEILILKTENQSTRRKERNSLHKIRSFDFVKIHKSMKKIVENN